MSSKRYDGKPKRLTPKRAVPKLHNQPHPTKPGVFWCSVHGMWERH